MGHTLSWSFKGCVLVDPEYEIFEKLSLVELGVNEGGGPAGKDESNSSSTSLEEIFCRDGIGRGILSIPLLIIRTGKEGNSISKRNEELDGVLTRNSLFDVNVRYIYGGGIVDDEKNFEEEEIFRAVLEWYNSMGF